MHRFYRTSLMWGLALLCFQTQATEQENGKYVWQFLSGQEWPQGYNRNIGKPDDLLWSRNEYTDDFFERIHNALPESELNEAFLQMMTVRQFI